MSDPRTSHNPAGMKHEIILSPQARTQFHGLFAYNRAKIRDAIDLHLQYCPTAVSRSRIKRLRGLKKPQYRLRVDELRVFYDVEEGVVIIHGIVDKPHAGKWLAGAGEPS
nr:MAG: mRNA-degrading endonuclease RelE, toxin component of the RelBE toxin-antitoxin system [Candidatus Kentron sp. TC]